MSLSYHIVQRPDKHKDAEEGATLYYGQVRVRQTVSFDRLCETIADRSTASKGDVQLVPQHGIEGRRPVGHRRPVARLVAEPRGRECRTSRRFWEFPYECRQFGSSHGRGVHHLAIQERQNHLHAWGETKATD